MKNREQWYNNAKKYIEKEIDNDPSYKKSEEAQLLGFCPDCNSPIDRDEITRMNPKQASNYRIFGLCLKCQDKKNNLEALNIANSLVAQAMTEIDEEGDKEYVENVPKKNSSKKRFENDKDIIDERFL